ncbi:redoxin domain-containing protein [Methylomonas sp. EFPC1]|uniref:redoxin domain-containing protein n=1 Tax=unclassified Methylomonas TaxID=2608980 RepID=UPI00051B63CD|nr:MULTISPECIES: redoxin domain-containing protein [unclassified Methylomonas]PKD40786.1 thioredoxin family protein [Methylomonas sp. Kb3]QBC27389.1 thioredoxin family protein [Methylomonas sp. LW13]QSA99528.1 redoxin domain-containing protein [Methylomonas sp. EFPC1]
MISQRLFGLMTVSLMLLMPALAKAEPVVGQPAPAFSAAAAEGGALSLAALRGKTVILEWTNADCPFVQKHYQSGNIPNLQKQAKNQNIVWLQVISSAPGKQGFVDAATAKKLNQERNATPANTLFDADGAVGKLYGATNTPHLFIIDPNGVLLYKGGIDSIASADQADIATAENYISSALKELAAGKPISKAVTKPYGCTVKYAG